MDIYHSGSHFWLPPAPGKGYGVFSRKGRYVQQDLGTFEVNRMRICGVELKGSEAILALVDVVNEEIFSVVCQTRKIKFGNSAAPQSARLFYDAMCGFICEHKIEQIGIKQRAPKGPFAGGPVTFKMEVLFQLNPHAATQLFSGPTIAAATRRHDFKIPDQLNQYQAEAYLTACCLAMTLNAA